MMIAADEEGEAQVRAKIRSLVGSINSLIDSPLQLPRLNPTRLNTGEIGTLNSVLSIIQVLSREEGTCIAMIEGETVQFHGLDLTGIVDTVRLRIRDNVVFAVVGTTTWSAPSGRKTTVFEVHCVTSVEALAAQLSEERVSAPDDLPLSEAESNQRNRAMALAAEKEAVKKSRELEAKAASKLSFAKKLIEKKESASARKWLEQVIRDFPETAAATEAKQLLDKLR